MSAANTTRSDAFAVTVDPSMTVREGEWDGARGEREIFNWATNEDGEIDWSKAARGFIVADLNPPAGEDITRASFKLPIAYVENDELVGIGNALRNALARLSQTEGLSDAVRAEAKAKLEGMLEKLRADHDRADAIATPDEATAPPRADAGERVYRTCTMDFALGAEDRVAVDRALAIADELGPRTDAAQVNAIAERLRADGFADKVTTDGRLIVTGYAARTGSQLYGDGKSTWYEYRSEDEVEKSLKSFDFATFTDDHPPVLVTADNWREYARGMLGEGAVLEPPDEHGLRYVKVKICVGDIGVIRKMRDGKVQLSTGYTTIAVRDPGVDAQGVSYTFRQTDIEVNHQSLVDEARAGPKARVLIDGAFVFEAKEHDMTKPKNDQMDPNAAVALLDAIKAYAYAESPEAADAAMQAIAVALELDPEMVKQHLSGGEMMEMDGVKLLVSKDVADKLRERERKINGDATKMATDLAATNGELAGLRRTVEKLEADAAVRAMQDLEREIAPLCPQLVSTWTDGKRPDSMTAMRVAAILDIDPAAKVDLDAARGTDEKPPPTFDAFVSSLYSSTKRQAASRSKPAPTKDHRFPAAPPVINTAGFHGGN